MSKPFIVVKIDFDGFDSPMFGEQTQHKNVSISFGSLKTGIVVKGVSSPLKILGFLPSDKSMIFTFSSPIAILGEDSFLPTLAVSMIKNNLDAIVFSDRDLILRAYQIEPTNGSAKKLMLMLCVPKKRLFEGNSNILNFPDYSLIMKDESP